MSIILPENLPAAASLAAEGLDVYTTVGSMDITRRLEICVFNLMPKKLDTELQLARVLGQTNENVSLTFAAPSNYAAKNAPPGHLDQFYKRWPASGPNSSFDAVVITGAPIEILPFEDVIYWREMTEILDWVRGKNGTNGLPLLSLCWGAQAALYHYYDIPKHLMASKKFGVYEHTLCEEGLPFLKSLGTKPSMPVSRWTETQIDDLRKFSHLKPLLFSEQSGLGALFDERLQHLHVLNHFEYDALTLDAEYRRDLQKGNEISLPENYYPDDDPNQEPKQTWGSNSCIFYSNWVRWLLQSKYG